VKGGVDVTGEREEITYRSDPEIFVDAKKALEDRPSIPPEVHVHVEYGNVTLTGSVRWLFERAEAEAAVRQVKGIRRLVNRITVAELANAQGFEPPDDRD
jgi:osmotically-inducible protein OsmY